MDAPKSSAPVRPTESPATRLAKLVAAYTHESMSVEERLDLRERIDRLRRKLSS